MLACLECWCLLCMACYTYGVWRLFQCLGIKSHEDFENQSSQRPLEELDYSATQDSRKPHHLGHSFQPPGVSENQGNKPIQVPPSKINTPQINAHAESRQLNMHPTNEPYGQIESGSHGKYSQRPSDSFNRKDIDKSHQPEKSSQRPYVAPGNSNRHEIDKSHQPAQSFQRPYDAPGNSNRQKIDKSHQPEQSFQRPYDAPGNSNRQGIDKSHQPEQFSQRPYDATGNSNRQDIDKSYQPEQSSQRPLESVHHSGTQNLDRIRLFERSTPKIIDKQEQIKPFVDPRSPPPLVHLDANPQHEPLKPLETTRKEPTQHGPSNDPNLPIQK